MKTTRREFLAVAAASSTQIAFGAEPIAIIDTHTHFYDPTRPEGIPWPGKDDKVLYRPVLPGEFMKLVKPHGVTGTVVVEASPWLKDNDWLLKLAKDHSIIKGVVGHLGLVPDTDLKAAAADDFVKHFEEYAKNPLYCGIRISGGDLKKAFEIKGFAKNVERMIELDRALDVNGGPEILLDTTRLAKEFPKLRIVVNHMANVPIDGKDPPKKWRDDMLAIGKHKNVWCKMSALVESSGKRDGKSPKELAFYRPTLDVLWDAFGEDRLVYGSNWPVSDIAANYATVFALADEFLTSKGKAAREKVFAANAMRAYKLPA